MTGRYRTALWTIFIVGFAITAPVLVLYTAGYRYNFLAGRVVETGILSIASTPRGAKIIIDGKDTGNQTPSIINNIQPGRHLIRLEKKDYLSWEKHLDVISRQTTFAENALLFLATEPIIKKPNILAVASPNREKIIYLSDHPQGIEIGLSDIQGDKQITILPITKTNLKIAWSPDNEWIYVISKKNLWLIHTGSTRALGNIKYDPINLDHLRPGAHDFSWDIYGRTFNFFVGGNLKTNYRMVSLPDGTVNSSQNVSQEYNDGIQQIKKLDEKTVVSWLKNSAKDSDVPIIYAYLPLGNYFFNPPAPGLISLYNKDTKRMILVDEYAHENNSEPIILNVKATNWQWNKNQDRLIYTDGFELHLYDANNHVDRTLTRVSNQITSLAWHPSENAIIYAQENEIFALELDGRDGHLITSLAKGKNLNNIAVSNRNPKLLFTGQINEVKGIFERSLQN